MDQIHHLCNESKKSNVSYKYDRCLQIFLFFFIMKFWLSRSGSGIGLYEITLLQQLHIG